MMLNIDFIGRESRFDAKIRRLWASIQHLEIAR